MKRRDILNRLTVALACKQQYERLIEPLREAARKQGYALAVHGTLSRDIDLIAVPWTPEASSAFVLMDALIVVVRRRNAGIAYVEPPMPSERAHGRLAWSIHLGGGPYLDISVTPRSR